MDKICGNCGEPESTHVPEKTGLYCYDGIADDVFTGEPTYDILMFFIREAHSSEWAELKASWQKAAGHNQ